MAGVSGLGNGGGWSGVRVGEDQPGHQEQSPEQEPGVPQGGVPAQRDQVGVRAVADQAGFDGHADRGQDSAVEHKDDRGHPRKDTQQTSRPVRAA